jgi:hypothetical protein
MRVKFGPDMHLTPGSKCPVCELKLDGATVVGSSEGKVLPVAGDFSVCIYCATLLCFGVDLQLAVATPDELRELHGTQPDKLALLNKLQQAVLMRILEARRKNFGKN